VERERKKAERKGDRGEEKGKGMCGVRGVVGGREKSER